MRIFISYSSKNKDVVETLADDIRGMSHDYDIWYDQELSGGQQWWDTIIHNLQQCDVFIFVMSLDSLESNPCKLEYTYASVLRRQILPVLIDERVDLIMTPVILQERQVVPYVKRDLEEYKTLQSTLRSITEFDVLPDPLPEPPQIPISPLARLKERIDQSVISLEEQQSLLMEIRGILSKDDQDYENAFNLLQRLNQHPLLYASVYKELQPILGDRKYIRDVMLPKRQILVDRNLLDRETHELFGDEKYQIPLRDGEVGLAYFENMGITSGLTDGQILFVTNLSLIVYTIFNNQFDYDLQLSIINLIKYDNYSNALGQYFRRGFILTTQYYPPISIGAYFRHIDNAEEYSRKRDQLAEYLQRLTGLSVEDNG